MSTTGALVYSTHIGGIESDSAFGVAVDAAGNAFVAGTTLSVDFPVLVPLQGSLSDTRGAPFVLKLNAAGSALLFSTYFGGTPDILSNPDFALAIAIDFIGERIHNGRYIVGQLSDHTRGISAFKAWRAETAFVAKISEPPPFDVCLQDDSNGNFILVNTTTGDYQFVSCGVLTLSGQAALSKKGCLVTVQVNGPDRRLLARIDTCNRTGTASMQVPSQGRTFSILDRNPANNACACSR